MPSIIINRSFGRKAASDTCGNRLFEILHNIRRSGPAVLFICLVLALSLFFSPPASAVTGQDIIDTAEQYLGYPYGHQCAGPYAFDCGGFVWYVYHMAGLDFTLRSSSKDLAAANTAIYDRDQLEIGDIVFCGSSPDNIGHWAIYAGAGRIIHSYNSSTGVVYTDLDDVVPGFCYACRIDGLLGYNKDSAEVVPDSDLNEQLGASVDGRLIPAALRCDYDEDITAEEIVLLLANVCELATDIPASQLLAGTDYDIEDLSALWTDNGLALASCAMTLTEQITADKTTGRSVAATGLLLSLFAHPGDALAEAAAVMPQTAPDDPYRAVDMPSSASILIAADHPQLVEAGHPLTTVAEGTNYSRRQAYLTMQHIYDLLTSCNKSSSLITGIQL